jgi:hypothetical protein
MRKADDRSDPPPRRGRDEGVGQGAGKAAIMAGIRKIIPAGRLFEILLSNPLKLWKLHQSYDIFIK